MEKFSIEYKGEKVCENDEKVDNDVFVKVYRFFLVV